jgi:hypothetical protein
MASTTHLASQFPVDFLHRYRRTKLASTLPPTLPNRSSEPINYSQNPRDYSFKCYFRVRQTDRDWTFHPSLWYVLEFLRRHRRCVLIHDTRAYQSQSLPRLDISHIQKSAGALLLNDSSGTAGPTGTAVLSPLCNWNSLQLLRNPTALGSLTYLSSAAISVHLPYTRSAGAMFTNTTSGAAAQTASSVFHPSRTGVSSSFAKPTEPANFTVPSASASKPISATGRTPFSKSSASYS